MQTRSGAQTTVGRPAPYEYKHTTVWTSRRRSAFTAPLFAHIHGFLRALSERHVFWGESPSERAVSEAPP